MCDARNGDRHFDDGSIQCIVTGCLHRRRDGLLTRRLREDGVPINAVEIEHKVPMIFCYPGMDDGLLEYLREKGLAGLVVEGFGAGNVPPGVVSGIRRLIQDRIPVVLTTRCMDGGVWPMYGYPGGGAELERMGVILGGRLTAHKAQILLMVAPGGHPGPRPGPDPAGIRLGKSGTCCFSRVAPPSKPDRSRKSPDR